MERNEGGTVDRAVRVLLGLILLGLWAADKIPYKTVALIVGLIALITGLTGGFCALYKLLGINTCKEC
ncbi:YgaP-like transmembrane domain [Thermococcus sp. JCM 11816]|uniref:YgaP family membrane protein n=1 Tax=Thermococcus sp. (strain JCM 11816 / KS-1) TaxID=1295125 RepID=UPI0006CF257E